MEGAGWWKSICDTVTRLGEPKGAMVRPWTAPPLAQPSAGPLVLDLHGLTVAAAYDEVWTFLNQPHATKWAQIITGKSGQIRQEFPHWMDQMGFISSEQKGGGSFRVRLRKIP